MVIITSSTFTDCTGGYQSFGYSDYGSVTISSSTFTDCTGGINSFGSSDISTTGVNVLDRCKTIGTFGSTSRKIIIDCFTISGTVYTRVNKLTI